MKEIKIENKVVFRIICKYVLIIFLILFTIVMIYGAWFQKSCAYLGYFGMLVVMALMMIYPSKISLYKDISKENYETILEYLSHSNEMSSLKYIEMLYIIVPEINKLMYANDQKEEYYIKNISLLQSLLKNKKDIVISHPITFSNVCKKLLEEYQNKNIYLDLYIEKSFEGKSNEISRYKIGISKMTDYIIPCILIAYLIFKIVCTAGFYQCIETNELLKMIYNVGADMIALITLAIEKLLNKNKVNLV